MKFKGRNISKRTLALLVAALVMLGSGGAMATRAVPNVLSDTFDTTINTAVLSVALTENGVSVGDGGALFESIGDKVEPGKTYADKIGVLNDGRADEYVRVVVRKYWTEPAEAEEGAERTDSGKKDTELSPEQIELALASGWTEKAGASEETKVYYYANPISSGDEVALFDSVKIASSVVTKPDITKTQSEDGKTTIVTYKYAYDGYSFHVEAEAQGVQTHNAKDAIKSVWGVDAGSVGINL